MPDNSKPKWSELVHTFVQNRIDSIIQETQLDKNLNITYNNYNMQQVNRSHGYRGAFAFVIHTPIVFTVVKELNTHALQLLAIRITD